MMSMDYHNLRGRFFMQDQLAEMAQLLNRYRASHQLPGLAVSMIIDGEVVYTEGFGRADINSVYSLVNADTVFSIQGITEIFTASALVHLQEHASFDLHAPIAEYLPYCNHDKAGHQSITTAHLLSHTAGFNEPYRLVPMLDSELYAFIKHMPEYQAMFENMPDIDRLRNELTTRAEVAQYLLTLKRSSSPGEVFHHFNDGYLIAADVLEKVSGKSWEEYVTTHIIEPLGLSSTTVNAPVDTAKEKIATYYMKGIGDSIETPTPYNLTGAPAGSMFTTAADLSTYLIAQMSPGLLLSESSLKHMQSPEVKIDEQVAQGLGWKIRDIEGLKVVEQTGSYPGISSAVTLLPDKKFGLVLLCNTDTIQLNKLALKIIKRFFC